MKEILVIEDNQEVRENIAELLSLSGYEVRTAEHGKAGVAAVQEKKPDLILCDVMMPELDGFGVLRVLGQNPLTMDIPFIFLTAKAEKEDFRKGMGLGADDYVTKPFDDVELLDIIEVRLKKAERIKQQFDGSKESLDMFFAEARAAKELSKLSEDRVTRVFKKKEYIYSEGQHPNWIFFISSGKVKLFRTNDYGKELIVSILGPGEFFGYLPVIQQTPYNESATAMEDCDLVLIPKQDFFLMLTQKRDFTVQFIKMLANNVSENEKQLIKLAYDSVRKRVATALTILYDKYTEDPQHRFSILREDLASLAGTAKETVIRTLSDFKAEHLIDIDDGEIIVKDIDKLRDMPN